MTCKLSRPDPQALFDDVKARFETTVLGGATVIPESLEWYVVTNDYAMQEHFYSMAEQQFQARDPREACCDDLVAMAALDGVYPKPAGFSQGYVRFTGTPNAALPTSIDIMLGSYRFRTASQLPAVMPSDGQLTSRVQAVVPGPDSNSGPASGTGTLFAPIAGVNNVVTPFGTTFCGGTEAEECEAFRTRYLTRMQYQPRATDKWLREKILEWPCATRVVERGGECCEEQGGTNCGCSNCGATNEYYVFADNNFECGIPDKCFVDELNEWLFGTPKGFGMGQVEIGVCGQVYAAKGVTLNVVIDGLGCATPSQIAQVRLAVQRVFRSAIPSTLFSVRSLEIAISQVMGGSDDFSVALVTPPEDIVDGVDPVRYTSCGDFDARCDETPCLGTITFPTAVSEVSACPTGN